MSKVEPRTTRRSLLAGASTLGAAAAAIGVQQRHAEAAKATGATIGTAGQRRAR